MRRESGRREDSQGDKREESFPPFSPPRRVSHLTYRRWTDEETALLERYLESELLGGNFPPKRRARLPIALAAKRLNRTEESVRAKAKKLGYCVQTTLDCYSMRYLAIQLGVDLNAVRWWIQRGYLIAKPNGKRRMSIRAKDFAQFIQDYPKISSKLDQEVVKWLAGQ